MNRPPQSDISVKAQYSDKLKVRKGGLPPLLVTVFTEQPAIIVYQTVSPSRIGGGKPPFLTLRVFQVRSFTGLTLTNLRGLHAGNCRQAFGDHRPRIYGIIAAINAPVMLQKHSIRIRRMVDDFVDTLSPFRILLIRWEKFRANTFISRLPILAGIVRSIDAAGRNRDEHAIRI